MFCLLLALLVNVVFHLNAWVVPNSLQQGKLIWNHAYSILFFG